MKIPLVKTNFRKFAKFTKFTKISRVQNFVVLQHSFCLIELSRWKVFVSIVECDHWYSSRFCFEHCANWQCVCVYVCVLVIPLSCVGVLSTQWPQRSRPGRCSRSHGCTRQSPNISHAWISIGSALLPRERWPTMSIRCVCLLDHVCTHHSSWECGIVQHFAR